MCDEGYIPQMLVIGDRLINRAQIISAQFTYGTAARRASLVIRTKGLVLGHVEGASVGESFPVYDREAEALHHFLFSGGYDVMKAYDCHEGKHIYEDDKAIVCENCRSWVKEREDAIRGTGHATDTDSIPF